MQGGKQRVSPRTMDKGPLVVTAVAEEPTRKREQPDLPHLTGLRAGLALWIVCHHIIPIHPTSSLTKFTMRVNVAVEMFMVVSGFVTELTYGGRDLLLSAGTLLNFYARRLSRVLVTCGFAITVSEFWRWWAGYADSPLMLFRCATLMQPWVDPMPHCPDGPTWFVASLIPCWLLYPVLSQHLLGRLQSPAAFIAVGVVLWLASMGPQLALMAQRGAWLSWNEVRYTWFWPPAQLGDFALGAWTAAAMKRCPVNGVLSGLLADAAIILVFAACLFVPLSPPPQESFLPEGWRPGQYTGWDQLGSRTSSLLVVSFLYFGSDGKSAIGRLLSHKTLTWLGKYTLEVYLFQGPLHVTLQWLSKPVGLWRGFIMNAEGFASFLVLLWFLSMLFAEFVAEPASKCVRNAAFGWTGRSLRSLLYYRVAAMDS